MKQNFIKTSDKSTAETLKNLNYQQVDFSDEGMRSRDLGRNDK